MKKIFTSKIFIISLITLLLSIPLGMIADKITERSHYFAQAKTSVANSWTGQQKVMGPLIVIPYVIHKQVEVWNKESKEKTIKIVKQSKQKYLLPKTLNIEALVKVDARSKGIYKIPVYTTQLNFSGAIDTQRIQKALIGLKDQAEFVTIGSPYLSATISDTRGINSIPVLKWANQQLSFKPGSLLRCNQNGIHAPLFELDTQHGRTEFNFGLELRGMESLVFVPTAMEVGVNVSSHWQHPQFVGRFLPVNREISEEGYQAEWKITSFASNIEDKIRKCENGKCTTLTASSFGVKHIEPVDVYLQSERSVKYGLLFIGLSFVSFFLFEVLKQLPIHSIQYTLVGFAIAVFYLLLVSLSEHIAFSLAYLIATLSCISLQFFYLNFVLRGVKQAVAFSVLLGVLYAVLYVIISAEDFAFLMGAVLTFVALSVVMITTRKVDWYKDAQKVNIPSEEHEAVAGQ